MYKMGFGNVGRRDVAPGDFPCGDRGTGGFQSGNTKNFPVYFREKHQRFK